MFATSLGDDGAEPRTLEPWQAEEFLAHMDRGRAFVGEHIGLADVVHDLDSARAFLRGYAEKTADDTGRLYGTWADDTLVGGVMSRTMDVAAGNAEVGCRPEPSAAGRGMVTRSCRTIIDWAVERRGIHRVEWYASTRNTASTAVARRLGMTREGVVRENHTHRGTRTDTEIRAVLAPEWRAAKTA
ncbi:MULTISPECIES: GNAT family N-acetyltransferase [unclassified Streptomyces]|uniref:GNAT family N-acetyltransferase n=1 Tax=unclassified Streptomyces TaxID=2593676 RepID=UPI0037035C46